MKPQIKLFIRLFIGIFIFFMIIMTLPYFVLGEKSHFLHLTALNFIFSLGLTGIIYWLHIHRLKRSGIKINEDILKIKHHKIIESDLNINQIKERLKSNPFTAKMRFNQTDEGLELTSGLSIWSYGEKIRIKPVASEGNKQKYEVSSRPLLKTTLIDYGKNLENVKKIEDIIKK